MKILLKIINVFFTVLGVIFFILLLAGIYFWIADPLNIKPLIFPSQITADNAVNKTPSSNPLLTQEQIAGLKKLGIDTSKIPTSISSTMEACLTAKLGATRTNEIKQGSIITAIDLYQAQSCLK
ncbi:MAG: hypothetical protein WC473_03105 [Patescibacteria group bacterium]|jgi:hypothetical protein